jgi:hypothetical protein
MSIFALRFAFIDFNSPKEATYALAVRANRFFRGSRKLNLQVSINLQSCLHKHILSLNLRYSTHRRARLSVPCQETSVLESRTRHHVDLRELDLLDTSTELRKLRVPIEVLKAARKLPENPRVWSGRSGRLQVDPGPELHWRWPSEKTSRLWRVKERRLPSERVVLFVLLSCCMRAIPCV